MTGAKKLNLEGETAPQPVPTTVADSPPSEAAVDEFDYSMLDPSIHVVENLEPAEVIRKLISTDGLHVVQKGSLCFEEELLCSHSMVERSKEFFINPVAVVLAQPLTIEPTFWTSVPAQEKKGKTISQFEDYLSSLKMSSSVKDSIMVAADELYTNGSKNAAPLQSLAAAAIIRTGRLEFSAHSDEKRLVLCCIDSFGELDVRRVLDRILKCYDEGVAQSIRQGEGGAGIGSFMVFHSAMSYYVGVDPGKKTVVCVTFPLNMSMKKASALPKNIHTIGINKLKTNVVELTEPTMGSVRGGNQHE